MLIWSAILVVVQMLIATFGALLQVGLPRLVGNRERMPALTGWAGRAERAYRNMLESLPIFAVLVLIIEITNHNDWLSGLGAEMFFGGRLAYAIVYVAGVPWLRTAVWTVSVAGLVLILFQLPLI